MRICSIRKKDDENVIVQFDNSSQLILSVDTLFKSGLKKGDEVSEDRFSLLIERNMAYHIKKKALSYLSRRLHTEKELIIKLKAKSYDENLIKLVIKELRELSFLNDKDFAIQFTEEKSEKKKWGKLKIKAALQNKGIDIKIINEVLSDYNLDNTEMQQVKELALKKYSGLQKKENDKRKLFQKLVTFLINRGYDFELSSKTVREIINADSDEY